MDKPKYEDFGLTAEQYENQKKRNLKSFDIILKYSGISGSVVVVAYILVTGDYSNVGKIVAGCILLGAVGIMGGMLCGMIAAMIYSAIKDNFVTYYKNIRAFDKAKREYDDWWTRRQIGFWTSMSGRRFEMELAYLYGQLGYGVNLTPVSGDKGIDIEMIKDGKKIIVQCKAHKKPIGPHTARDLYGTLVNSKADKAILASTSGFTKGVMEFVVGKPIELVAVSEIIRMQKSLDGE